MDGGNIAATVVDAVVPGRGRRIVQWWTMAVTIVAVVAVVLLPTYRPWALTVGLFAIWSFRSFAASRPRSADAQDAARRAAAVAAAGRARRLDDGAARVLPPAVLGRHRGSAPTSSTRRDATTRPAAC